MVLTMKPDFPVHRERLEQHDWASVLVKSARFEISSTYSISLLSCEFHERDTLVEACAFIEGTDDLWHLSKAMIMRKNIVGVLGVIPSNFIVS